ncbi:PaaI family thioesterase [Salipaludibacillus agaradhaerens]|uniref:Medium/long-chain acyl-CoA thioesterase YigI n=1 Tax=Salipaludibacillus agaradhaerens TaxID=76935 RepID=A0A9Q4B2Y7_SALAG|nr:PaaI family thioesterase [Salipaludibacillus agaradhaerens]MCR6097032.1 PaaI family thioesterase [Salipaludibacillus agaradhaerens]MCR6113483.1 PaaI family thioesterase [Salipaludibacillus agaradhaerens]
MDEKIMINKTKKAVQAHNNASPDLFLYSLMDFEFIYDEKEETVTLVVPITDVMYNQLGYIHGGIMAYIADTAMGHLCAAFNNEPSVTLELKTQFIKTATSGTLTAKASFIKKGGHVQFVECTIHNDKAQLLNKITGTFYSQGKA